MRDHRPGHVRVEVEGDGHGHRRSDDLAHRAEEIALAVLEPLGHHGAVQIEQHAVETARRAEVGE